MEQKDFIRRIIENGNGKFSHDDFLALEAWKAKSDDNRAFAESLEKTLNLTKDFGQEIEFDAADAFNSFQQRISEKKVIPLPSSNNRRNFLKIAASFALLLAVVSGLWFTQNSTTNEMVSIYSEKGESLTLVDKSKVILNQKANLKHFTSLNSKSRKVKLEGEAFFDVNRMTEKPFLINTNSILIEVLGTSFNVRDYDAENESLVFVKSGKVKISSLKTPSKKIILTAGEQVVFNKKSVSFRKTTEESHNTLSWMEGKLSFKNTKLQYVIRDLERYFHINIDLKNKDLLECPYTSLFNEPQKLEIIETIAAVFDLQLKQSGDSNYELSGGACD